MTTAFILGNGTSRMGLDLDAMRRIGPVIGCNAIYRDWLPDVVVAVDRGMIHELRKAAVEWWKGSEPLCALIVADRRGPIDKRAIVRVSWNCDIGLCPDPGMSSGPTAGWILPMLFARVTRCYLIGMDQGTPDGERGCINNIYAGTANYAGETAPQSTSHHWARAWRRVFDEYPGVLWLWRRPWPGKQTPEEWETAGNVDTIEGEPWL